MHNNDVFKIKIAGQAGQGIKSAGLIFSKFLTRSGFNVYNYLEYPSLIRGGHNVMQINVSTNEVSGPSKFTDFVIALNQESILKHRNTLSKNSYVLFDSDAKLKTDLLPENVQLLPVPLNKIAHDAGGGEILINIASLGVLAGLMDGNLEILKELVTEEYGDKPNLLKSDLLAIEEGYKYALENFSKFNGNIFKLSNKLISEPKMLLNGNDAVALGAISAGLQFAAIYPMSPISNILHTLAKYQEEYNFIYKQPEDEISAINMAIGASFGGARSMTATSGGGFCLMTEGYGLAGMTETPLVIIEGMRGGPATGLPTWNGQGDLQFVLHAHQDEFPRLVLAAGDVNEAFYMTMEAFYLADKYQTPVVVLIDKNICDHEQSVSKFDISAYRIDRGKMKLDFDSNYKRYSITENGISPRTIPGLGNFFVSNSDEHDQTGFSSEEIDNRLAQMNKRMKKLEICAKTDMPAQIVYGSKDADLTIVSWGSNKGSIVQAIEQYKNVNYLHITWMNPFPVDQVKSILTKAKKVLLMECNYSGQLGQVITQHTGIEISDKILKIDGRPFFVEEVKDAIEERLYNKKGVTK